MSDVTVPPTPLLEAASAASPPILCNSEPPLTRSYDRDLEVPARCLNHSESPGECTGKREEVLLLLRAQKGEEEGGPRNVKPPTVLLASPYGDLATG